MEWNNDIGSIIVDNIQQMQQLSATSWRAVLLKVACGLHIFNPIQLLEPYFITHSATHVQILPSLVEVTLMQIFGLHLPLGSQSSSVSICLTMCCHNLVFYVC